MRESIALGFLEEEGRVLEWHLYSFSVREEAMSGKRAGLGIWGLLVQISRPAAFLVLLPVTEHSDESPLFLRDRAVSGV